MSDIEAERTYQESSRWYAGPYAKMYGQRIAQESEWLRRSAQARMSRGCQRGELDATSGSSSKLTSPSPVGSGKDGKTPPPMSAPDGLKYSATVRARELPSDSATIACDRCHFSDGTRLFYE